MKKVIIWFLLFFASVGVMYWLAHILGLPWQLTESILFMIGLHELGHLTMAKRLGYKTAGFYFVPGLGGAAILKEVPRRRSHCFLIWCAGPVVGLLLTMLLAIISYFWWQTALAWHIVAVWGFINFINLLPIFPLDGGMMMWSICSGRDERYLFSFLFWFFTVTSFVFFFYIAPIFAVLVLWLGLKQRNYKIALWTQQGDRLPMTSEQRGLAFFYSFALITALFFLAFFGASMMMTTIGA